MKLMACVYQQYIIQENHILFRKPLLLGPPLSLPEHTSEVRQQGHRTTGRSAETQYYDNNVTKQINNNINNINNYDTEIIYYIYIYIYLLMYTHSCIATQLYNNRMRRELMPVWKPVGTTYTRSLLGWLETRLAQITSNHIRLVNLSQLKLAYL